MNFSPSEDQMVTDTVPLVSIYQPYCRRREGKGRRCCLGHGIDSIPCRTSYSLHQDDYM